MQQEMINLHRRIEARDTTTGILVAAGVALLLYAMGNKHDWRPFQLWFVILAFIGTILLIVALIFVPSISSDWLRLRVFDDGIQNDAATVLKNTLEGGKDVYGIGVVAEKGKEGLCKLGLWIFTVGATGYMAFGQRDGGWWFFIGWGTVALLGISNWLMVKYVLK